MRTPSRTGLVACIALGITAAHAVAGCSGNDSGAGPARGLDSGSDASDASAASGSDATVDDGGEEGAPGDAPGVDSAGDVFADFADGDAPVDSNGDVIDGGPETAAIVDSGSDGWSGDAIAESGGEAVVDSAPPDVSVDSSVFDSASDASDGEVVDAAVADADDDINTLGVILGTQGALCQACAQQMCVDAGTACEHLSGQVADAGPAAGQSRQQLCYTALTCVLNATTACYNEGNAATPCYCGAETTQDCAALGPEPGAACTTQEENGLETTDPSTVLQRLYDTSFGAGTANAILLCLGDNCIDCE
jgi:hypothetical protein